MATKSISQLESAAAVSNNDLYETAIPDIGSATGYASKKQSLAAIADHIATQVNYPGLNTTAKSITGAVNEVLGTILTDTLTAGNTTLTFTNAAILTTSTIDIYTDTFGVNPTAVTVSSGEIVLTFAAQATDVAVKVRIS